MEKKFGIAIHGGAGNISKKKFPSKREKEYKDFLKKTIELGYAILKKGGSSLDAIIECITLMEDSFLFNAGRGAVLNENGEIEHDAAIMDGENLEAGALSCCKYVKNPIKLAEKILKSPHVMLFGEGTYSFAKEHDLEIVPNSYFYDKERIDQLEKAKKDIEIKFGHDKYGTVGAVALDEKGNLAAGTSTGGIINKKKGRVGDTPIIGSGTYADNETCAVSCTGHGEYFLRYCVGHELSCRVKYKNESLEYASNSIIHDNLLNIGGKGGLIAIDKDCNISMPFNTSGMFRASKNCVGEFSFAVF